MSVPKWPAFEDFYVDAFPEVNRLVAGLVGRNEAWDITQDAFVQTLRKWDSLRGPEGPLRFTCAVAINLSRSWLRRLYAARSRLPRTARNEEIETPLDGRIEDAIRSLPRRQREALVLCDVVGMSAADAAEILKANPGTTRVHVSRARRAMRVMLDGYDEASADSPSPAPGPSTKEVHR